MNEATIKKCLTCGGELIPDGHGIPTCAYCGRQYKDAVGGFSRDLEEIVHRRQLREFIQAEELCKELLSKQPDNSEVYWQLLLASLGVVYVQEDSGKAKPTFFSYSYDDRDLISNNENYKKALEYAKSPDDREYYRTQADILDSLLKEFFNLVAKEDSYDIFISFKRTEEAMVNGSKKIIDTDDYFKAQEIYNYLSTKYKVFFSPVSIGKDTGIQGEKYEPRILKALQTSQAMILLGGRAEYLEAQWVQNEWKRYQYFQNKGKKSKASLILGYEKNMPPLPAGLRDIQLPMFDWFKAGYLKELEGMLSFVRSSKGIKSSLKERKVNSNFETDANFEMGYTGTRVTISSKGKTGIVISASDETTYKLAESMLQGKKFGGAKSGFNKLIQNNSNNSKAYWGRFKASIKADKDETVPYRITDKGTEEFFGDIDQAIECSNDESFSWNIVDTLIQTLRTGAEWSKQKKVFDFVLKYLDDNRSSEVLKLLSDKAKNAVNSNANTAVDIFECSRQLFFEDNKAEALGHLKRFADSLSAKGYYDLARKYFEELASVQRDSDVYLSLLACRLKTSDITKTKFKLKVNPDDDASSKKPSELDLDEIIERAIICTSNRNFSRISARIQKMILYQVQNNKANVKPFIETAVSCYVQLKKEQKATNLLLKVSETFIQKKDFKNAQEYFTAVLSRDTECSRAHWGLLMCRLRAFSEVQLLKKADSLPEYPECQNAINCASEEEFEHYSSILNGRLPTSGSSSDDDADDDTIIGLDNKSYLNYRAKIIRRVRLATFLVILPLLLFGMVSIILSAFNVAPFFTFWAITSFKLFGSIYFEFLFLGIFLILFIVMLSLNHNLGGYRVITANLIFIGIMAVLGIVGGATVNTQINSADSLIYAGGRYIAEMSEEDGEYTVEHVYYGFGKVEVELPSEFHEKEVAYLGEDILSGNVGKVSVVLPETVSYISSHPFSGNKKLISVSIPVGVTGIAEGAFNGCSNLQSISLPFVGGSENNRGTATSSNLFGYIFGEDEFENAVKTKQNYNTGSFEEYYIPQSLTSVTVKSGNIMYGAFYGCENILDVTVGSGVESISSYAFFGCNNLQSISLPFVGAKKDGSGNTYFGYIFGTGTYESNVSNIPSTLETVRITDGETINANAFRYCNTITTVILPDTLLSIGNNAFDHCVMLENVHMPDGLLTIGSGAFASCALSRVVVPDSVERIGLGAFNGCKNLEGMTLPFIGSDKDGAVNSRLGYIFSTNATSNDLNSAVPSILWSVLVTGDSDIGDRAFYGCNRLTNIVLSGKIERIGTAAFYNCTGLTDIEIPSTVTSIGGKAFSGCTSLNFTEYDKASYLGNAENPYFVLVGVDVNNITSCSVNADTKIIAGEAFYSSVIKSIKIPNSVITIGERAFYNCGGLTVIEIPSGLKSIEDGVFYGCTGLTTVTIPDGVASIGDEAFYNCGNLTEIVIPSSVEKIGSKALYGCTSIESITLPFVGSDKEGKDATEFTHIFGFINNRNNVPRSLEKVTVTGDSDIWDYAFAGLEYIKSIYITGSVEHIGDNAFLECTNLETLSIPNSVATIGRDAFLSCGSLQFNEEDGVSYLGNAGNPYVVLISSSDRSVTSVNVNANTKIIYDHAFAACTELTDVVLPDGIKGIGFGAFESCSALETIKLPSSLVSIGNNAFDGCSSLASVTLPDGLKTIGRNAFHSCVSLTEIVIPSSVTSIGEGALSFCTGLESVTLPFVGGSANPEKWGEDRLFGYIFGTQSGTDLVSARQLLGSNAYYTVYLPKSLKNVTVTGGELFYGAFSYCELLESVKLTDGVTAIGVRAFEQCLFMTDIEIADSVESIGEKAFYGCLSLKNVTLPSGLERIEKSTFELSGLEQIELPEGLKYIGDYAFKGCSHLESIVIPDSVETIGDGVFRDCTSLTSVVFPSGLKSIGSSLFDGCNSLEYEQYENALYVGTADNPFFMLYSCIDDMTETCVVHEDTKIISNFAFRNFTALKTVELPDGLTAILDSVFYNCTALEEIVMGDNVTSIGESAFEDCSSLQTVKLSKSLVSIGDSAFAGCESLESITLPNSVTTIGDNAFKNCVNLSNIEISDELVSIGTGVFDGCGNLKYNATKGGLYLGNAGNPYLMFMKVESTSVSSSIFVVNANTKIIYEDAFKNYGRLTGITLPDGLKTICAGAFYDCSNLTSIDIPNGVTFIGEDAFTLCNSLATVRLPSNLTSIEANVFAQCYNLKDIGIPGSVTSIGDGAFYDCELLESVKIPNSVKSIGKNAFSECHMLKSITLSNTLESIGSNAFFSCFSLEKIVIPMSVTKIGTFAFDNCYSITIYCEAEEAPSGFGSSWNAGRTVVWGYAED